MQLLMHFFIIFALLAAPARAQDLSATDAALISEIERYFNDLSTFKADFTQSSPDGSIAYGRFFMKRPGRLRWQYDPPVPILMVVNHGTLAYQDFELDQVSHLPINQHLMGIFTREDITFGKDVSIQHVSQTASLLRATFALKGMEADGSMTLIFDNNPHVLRKIEMIDANGHVTAVSFSEIQTGITLKDSLFTIDYQNRPKRTKN